MAERIRIGDKWYVAATASGGEDRPQVLKHAQTFAMFDHFGNIEPGEQGLYHEDTRFLSLQELTVNRARPLFLGASIKQANSLLIVELMNSDLVVNGAPTVLKGTVHVFRAKLLWQGTCYEHIRLTNHGLEAAPIEIDIHFAADFVDLFQVRGVVRKASGERPAPEVGSSEVVLPYLGLDGVARRTRLHFAPKPTELGAGRAHYEMVLQPGEESHLYCTVGCESDASPLPRRLDYDTAFRQTTASRSAEVEGQCAITTSNPLINRWLERSLSDLAMLTTELDTGRYPFAGVPWYCTTFGRDGILTAMECLWVDPSLAAGVLRFLAETQASGEDPGNDAEPGKILHEARLSEMARTGEVPFRRYYGTVDATPLFVALAGAYHRWTGDIELIRRLWPNLKLALQWIDRHGDADGDGFVEYARRSAEGLTQQGWKDSQDSIFHADGELAEAPIALCEVQGYVYQAKLAAAELARVLGDAPGAQRFRDEAASLKQRFDAAFWCEEIGNYAIALDGHKRQCKVRSSNAGHALWSGIAAPGHAHRVIDGFVDNRFFSGWGIRTIAVGEARYNPMSYHNGSIWPHDNALIAVGMARYDRPDEATVIFNGMFDASLHFDQHRLPELFCGFPRRGGEGPTLYPVACSPQAWAAAAVYAMLQGCLGVDFDAETRRLALRSPRLPSSIDWLEVKQLGVPGCSVDLVLKRYERSVGVEVVRKDAGIEVCVMN